MDACLHWEVCPLDDQILHSVMKSADPCLSTLTDVRLRHSLVLIYCSGHGQTIET